MIGSSLTGTIEPVGDDLAPLVLLGLTQIIEESGGSNRFTTALLQEMGSSLPGD